MPINCSNCNKEYSDDRHCSFCRFPHNGNKEELAKFFARQAIDMGEVKSARRSILAGGILLILLSIYSWVMYVFFITPEDYGFHYKSVRHFCLFLAIIFLISGVISFWKPLLIIGSMLITVLLYYIYLFTISPALIVLGVVWKLIIVTTLAFSFYTTMKSKRILAKNPYLNSLNKKKQLK